MIEPLHRPLLGAAVCTRRAIARWLAPGSRSARSARFNERASAG